ncbi:large ribosomal subunit protein bL21 [Lacunimicrobium album]|jgi:ribosomal protein L21
MFAIIAASGRQIRVSPNELVRIDFEGDDSVTSLTFEDVLLATNDGKSVIGKPVISGAKVAAEIVRREEKGPKLEIGKMRRRKNFRKHTGHRQKYTAIRILSIDVPGLGKFEPIASADKIADMATAANA